MKKYVLAMLMGTVIVSASAFATPSDVVAEQKEQIVQTEQQAARFVGKKKQAVKEMRENFVKKLNLTEEQQKKADEIHQQSKPRMKEIMQEMKTLRKEADEIRAKDRQAFEALLDDNQKKTLEEMKKSHEAKKHRKKPMK